MRIMGIGTGMFRLYSSAALCRQLLTKVIPTRRAQLLEIYGPEGSGLVPCPQPAAPPMNIKDATNEYVEIENNNSFAVDMSNWVIGGDTYFKCPPGKGFFTGCINTCSTHFYSFFHIQNLDHILVEVYKDMIVEHDSPTQLPCIEVLCVHQWVQYYLAVHSKNLQNPLGA